MSDHVVKRFDENVSDQDNGDEEALRRSDTPSGKLYEWQLPDPENPVVRAMLPQILVERAFTKAAGFNDVLERTAAYFIVISRNNGYEGRDPHVIDEDIRCGAVSDFLGIEIDILGRALLEFQRRGIVSPCGEGNLHLDDVAALDRLSDGLPA